MLPSSLVELAALAGVDQSELETLSGAHYRRFLGTKRDGSPRDLAEPPEHLKETQRRLLRRVWESFQTHNAAHAVVGRSALTNAAAHIRAIWICKFDIRDFFPSVSGQRIEDFLYRNGASEAVARTLADLATTRETDSLPQGAPTSTQIANVLCYRMDRRITHLAARLGATYTRYVDDLTLSFRGAKVPFRHLRKEVDEIIAAEGFRLHPSKTRSLRAPTTVTGYVVGLGTIRASRVARRNLRAAEHNATLGRGDPDRAMGLWAFCEGVENEN